MISRILLGLLSGNYNLSVAPVVDPELAEEKAIKAAGRTSIERLDAIGIDSEVLCEIYRLERYQDQIHLTMMTNPVVIVPRVHLAKFRLNTEEEASPQNFNLTAYLNEQLKKGETTYIVDQETINKHYAAKGGLRIDPFTNQRCVDIPYTALADEIHAFIRMHELMVAKYFQPDAPHYTHAEHLAELGLYDLLNRTEQLPKKFVCTLSGKIMTYPLQVNDLNLVDYPALLQWWAEHPEKNGCHPVTGESIVSIELDRRTFSEIDAYVKEVQQVHLRRLYADIEKIIDASPRKETAHTRLIRTGYTGNTPAELILDNFSGEIISHPVILDDKNTVDFAELVKWQHSAPENAFKNFYTDKLIKSIRYDHALKAKIESFVAAPIASVANAARQRLYHVNGLARGGVGAAIGIMNSCPVLIRAQKQLTAAQRTHLMFFPALLHMVTLPKPPAKIDEKPEADETTKKSLRNSQ